MEQKLRSALPARTAWIILGICVLFWLLSARGLLQLPASVPPVLMFFWLYLNALAALLSTVAAVAAVAALFLHRRGFRPPEPPSSAPGSALDQTAEEAVETGLDQLLEGPAASLAPEPAAAAASTARSQEAKAQPAKKRRRR